LVSGYDLFRSEANMRLHQRTFKTRLLKGMCDAAILKGETSLRDSRIRFLFQFFQHIILVFLGSS
jgi:hypothetical protein